MHFKTNSLITWLILCLWNIAQILGLHNRGKVISLAHMDRWSILDYHNSLRRDVPASNMQVMAWDRQAASAARAWVKKCNFDRPRNDPYGENLFYESFQPGKPSKEILMDSMRFWAGEKDLYTPRKDCGSNRKCDYLKIITGDVESVGCAVAKCPNLQTGKTKKESNVNFVVCFYYPYVDVSRVAPYIPGEPCTHCKTGFSCKNKLCTPPLLPLKNITFGQEFDLQLKGEKVKSYSKINTELREPVIKSVSVSEYNRVLTSSKGGEPAFEELRSRGEERINSRGRTGTNRVGQQQAEPSHRVKRQARRRYYDSRYVRNNRYATYEEQRRQYQEARRRYEERRREREEEIRRLQEQQRRRPRPRPRPAPRRRRPYRPYPIIRPEGRLTENELNNLLEMHNTYRRDGLPRLAISRHLQRWADYVIRCNIEYPGPINCYTNFGKVPKGEEIYSIVYRWSREGDDTYQKLSSGCRTPYDRSHCNHNTIIQNRDIREMACSALDCGAVRNVVCIYQ